MESVLLSQLFNRSSKPSPDTTAADTTTSIPQVFPLKDIPINILAFRTITKLLALIQQEQAFRTDTGMPAADQRLELKLINALSTVAVIDHEVVAVVNKSGNDSGKVGLIAYVKPPNDTTPSESSIFSLWKVLFSQNFRPDSSDSHTPSATGQPVIFSAQVLGGLPSLDSDEAIKAYAKNCW